MIRFLRERLAPLVLTLVLAAAGVQAQEYKVVAHAAAGVTELSAAQANKLFLKQERNLAPGVPAVPVNLAKTSPVRAAFSQAVHGRAVQAIEQYWQQQLFSGRETPPDVKAGDAAVLEFVKATPGAIGYVSASASIPAGVNVITIK